MRASVAGGAMLAMVGCFSNAPPITADGSSSSGEPEAVDSTGIGPTDGGPADTTTADDTVADTVPDTTTHSVSSSDGPAPECIAEGGVDEACDPAVPYCVDGHCGNCAALPSGCLALDPAAPYCDPATDLCGPCTEHEHCDSGACRIKTGECVAETNRLWVDAAADCDTALGNQAAPFCTIAEALAAIDAQANEEPFAVFVEGSATLYDAWADAPPAQPIAIIGPSAGIEARIGSAAEPVIVITGSGQEIYFARVTLESPSVDNTLIACQQGEIWIDDATLRQGRSVLEIGTQCEVRARRALFTGAAQHAVIVQSGGVLGIEDSTLTGSSGAILVEGTVNVDRSYVDNHYGLGGIDVQSGSLRMTNSILRSNVYAIGNIQATGNADVELLYVTAFADSVACDAPTVTFTIRNSAVQFVDCAQATIDNSLVAEGAVGQGMGNVDFPLTLAELESIFEDPAGGELHLEETPPVWLLGIAVRGASDPPTDIDGDPRPRAGDDDYPGADVP